MKLPRITKHTGLKLSLAIWFTTTWSWALFTDSLTLAGSKTQGVILAIIVMSINVSMSIFVALKGLQVVQKIYDRYNIILATIVSLFVLASLDFLISWIPAIFWIGPEGRLDSILPLSSPTLLLINTPVSFASRLIGFYGLAAFCWLVFYLVFLGKNRQPIAWLLISLALTSGLGYALYKDVNGNDVTTKVVSETLDERVESINPINTKLVVFPEYGLDKITNENLSERIEIGQNLSANKSFLIGSEQILPEDKIGHYNRFIFGDTVDGYLSKQDKYRLIPGGEDLPYILRAGLRATNQKSTLDYFSFAKGTLKGESPLKIHELDDGTKLGSAVCSSIIAPQDYRDFAKRGATLFTNSASLSIFRGSPIFAYQQKSLAKFMSIANSRYFLQSANAARAFVLDNNGKTLVEGSGHQVLDAVAKNNSQRTVYTIIGEWMVVTGFLSLIWLLYVSRFKPRPKSNKSPKKSLKKMKHTAKSN